MQELFNLIDTVQLVYLVAPLSVLIVLFLMFERYFLVKDIKTLIRFINLSNLSIEQMVLTEGEVDIRTHNKEALKDFLSEQGITEVEIFTCGRVNTFVYKNKKDGLRYVILGNEKKSKANLNSFNGRLIIELGDE